MRSILYLLRVALAICKGWFLKLWLPMTGRRFRAGRNLRVFGSLKVRGPGAVVFGDDVVIEMTVTPFTHSPAARIQVGNGVYLNGTRFGCVDTIDVGDGSIISDARIMDSDFHSIDRNRRSADAKVRVHPIQIGANVWIAAQTGVLPGSVIGENSVVAFGSVCTGVYPADVLVGGNPAKVLRAITAPATAQQNGNPQ